MAATRTDRRFLVFAWVLSLVALAVLISDKVNNPHIENRQTFDLLQLIFASIALVCGIALIVRSHQHDKAYKDAEDDYVIDLRERLAEAGYPDGAEDDVLYEFLNDQPKS
jgi:hypothetical protein